MITFAHYVDSSQKVIKAIKDDGTIIFFPAMSHNSFYQELLTQGLEITSAPPTTFREPVWDGTAWIDNNPLTYQEKRKLEYEARGITIEALTVALFEQLKEGRSTEADSIQVQRLEVKALYPKP